MLLAVADAALQNISGSVLGILSSAESCPPRAAFVALSLAFKVRQGIVVGLHETTVLSLAFAFSFASLEGAVHVPSELADWFSREPSPCPPCLAVLHVNAFG